MAFHNYDISALPNDDDLPFIVQVPLPHVWYDNGMEADLSADCADWLYENVGRNNFTFGVGDTDWDEWTEAYFKFRTKNQAALFKLFWG